MRITAIVGNPKSRSKSYGIAAEMLRFVRENLGSDRGETDDEVIDLADVAPALLEWGHADVRRLVDRVCGSDIVIVVSPTFKATYTGLLKLFIDQLPMQALAGIAAIPVMVGAAPHHALAVEAHLRPLLVEAGAICPTRGLYLLDSQIDHLSEVLGKWRETSLLPLRGVVLGKGA
jgi:FMN reductase